jgi:hypothetical protein
MKVLKNLSLVFLIMTIALSCNQSNSKKQEKTPQREQRQIPEQPVQKSDPFQQPAQNNVSDEELKLFAAVNHQVQIIKNEVQQKMKSELEEKGLDLQRFREFQQAQLNPQQEIAATNAEIEKYKVASKELERIQEQANQRIKERISESGLTISRFEEIHMLIQRDSNLKQRFQMIQPVK